MASSPVWASAVCPSWLQLTWCKGWPSSRAWRWPSPCRSWGRTGWSSWTGKRCLKRSGPSQNRSANAVGSRDHDSNRQDKRENLFHHDNYAVLPNVRCTHRIIWLVLEGLVLVGVGVEVIPRPEYSLLLQPIDLHWHQEADGFCGREIMSILLDAKNGERLSHFARALFIGS